jgi:lipopolysaccharide export system protein LptA
VLVTGVLLVAALGVFLVRGRFKNPLDLKELPKRLGVDIQSDATGFTLEHAMGAHGRYKIHASKAVTFKQGKDELHDVKIELYSDDGQSVDRIEGAEFEYDQNNGIATATGPVEITLVKPAEAPAIAPKAAAGKEMAEKAQGTPLGTVEEMAGRGEVHVKTSGLSFNEKTTVATTSEHVDFSMVQGSGSSMGATYNSKTGLLVLDHAVELNSDRNGERVTVHAQHAEFERNDKICRMRAAVADYKGGQATAGDATILFREDGSAVQLDAVNGVTLTSANGGKIEAPKGALDFNEKNQPRHGHMEGGVKMDSVRAAANGVGEQHAHGTAPEMELEFTSEGDVQHAHLERGVEMASEEWSGDGADRVDLHRTWKSPVADIVFRKAGTGQSGPGQGKAGQGKAGQGNSGGVEPETITGIDGVVVTSESHKAGAAAVPSSLAADTVKGFFGPNSQLAAMNGMGHARLEEITAAGVRQTSTGDRLEARFKTGPERNGPEKNETSKNGAQKKGPSGAGPGGATQIESAVLDGHVVMVQEPAKGQSQDSGVMRATAARAEYEGTGDWLHLTGSPHVVDGTLDVTADRMDVSRQTGDAFGHGHVKATSLGGIQSGSSGPGGGQSGSIQSGSTGKSGAGSTGVGLGGQGPSHAIAAEAHLQQTPGAAGSPATNVVTFTGHARLWQDANSVAGPTIVLDRAKQTLVARSEDPGEPVEVVLLSAAGKGSPQNAGQGSGHDSGQGNGQSAGQDAGKSTGAKQSGPSVIRVYGGDLKYSDAERKAVMKAGDLSKVTAETGTESSTSNEVELVLLPVGNHAGKDGGAAQVDRMTARGHVVVNSEGRRGTGEQLVYTSESGEYVLTGTSATPPWMTDPARGKVTGEALIFNSRDDSVSIEGGGRRTTTETTAPK